MTYDARTRPHLIRPADAAGAIVTPGIYGLEVVAEGGPDGQGSVDGLIEVISLPAGGDEAETLSKASSTDGDAIWVASSVPTVLLPNGAVPADMATYAPNAPYGTIVRFKA